MTSWWFSKGTREFGPVSAKRLRGLARSGQLRPSDLVLQEGKSEWVPARRVRGLFEVSPVGRRQPRRLAGQTPVRRTRRRYAPDVPYAGFWQRVAAACLDMIVVSVGALVIGFVVALPLQAALRLSVEGLTLWTQLVGCIGAIGYFAGMESSGTQGTLGKMAVGIRVTDLDGNQLSFGRSLGRYFAKYLSGLVLGFGFMMPAFTRKKQCLHDMVAGCLVLSERGG